MAVPARFEIVDHEARLRSGDFAASPYGSLMGGRAAKPRKKPVLVLDPDELEQAHMAIAMGGAQIMDEAGDPAAAQRPRVPAMLLGLAPVGADEDWEPPVAPARPAAPVTVEDEWDGGDDAGAPFAAPDEEAFAFEEPEPEPEPEPEIEPEAQAASDVGPAPLGHLLQPPASQADDDWEASIPSIEEQLRRMRHLTAARAPLPLAAQEPSPPTEPAEADRIVPEPILDPEPEPVAVATPEPAPQAVEPEWIEAEPVLDLPLAAAMDPVPAQPEPEPDPLPATVEQYEDDGPDLSWMMPRERRQLHFGEASQSSLRARLVQHPAEPEPDLPPSLWDRLRAWLRGLLG